MKCEMFKDAIFDIFKDASEIFKDAIFENIREGKR